MRLKDIMTINFITVIRFTIFYLLNFFRYRRLSFKSFIDRPLRISGREYIEIDKNVRINKYAWLVALKIDVYDPKLTIGEGCSLGDFNHIAAVRSVAFGKFVLTANGVYISDNLHSFENIHVPIMHQPVVFKSEVSVGDGTWIGEHACIIGAKIGKHCVIGANAVVTKDVPDYSVVAGAPARVIKRYNLLTMKWEKIPVQDDMQETGPSREGKE